MALPVALQLFSVRDDMAKDYKATLKAVAEMGYQGVELAGIFGNAEEMKAELDKNGLVAISAHVGIDAILNDTEKTLGAHKTIGCKYIAIPYLADEDRPDAIGFDGTAEKVSKACKLINEYGMIALYHNHAFEFDLIDGKHWLDTMYECIPADVLQTELDTCWVNVGGEDPAEYIYKYAGRAPVLHLKDFVQKGRKLEDPELDFAFRPFGHGVQEHEKILEAAEKCGVEWLVVEQDSPQTGKTPIESVKLSREFLKKAGF